MNMKNRRFALKGKGKKKYICTDNNPTIRVSANTYNILVELANQSGLSLSSVANCAVDFAYKNYDETVEG